MKLLALAVAPGFAISLFFYKLDKYDREPVGLLLRCFLLGMVCVILPLFIQSYATSVLAKRCPAAARFHHRSILSRYIRFLPLHGQQHPAARRFCNHTAVRDQTIYKGYTKRQGTIAAAA